MNASRTNRAYCKHVTCEYLLQISNKFGLILADFMKHFQLPRLNYHVLIIKACSSKQSSISKSSNSSPTKEKSMFNFCYIFITIRKFRYFLPPSHDMLAHYHQLSDLHFMQQTMRFSKMTSAKSQKNILSKN